MRGRIGWVATTMAAVALTACGTGTTPETAAPAPTVTVTVTETATPSPAPTATPTEATATPTETAPATGDPCASSGLDSLAFIFVTTPTVGSAFSDGDAVEGCANVFEAAYSWELLDASQTVLDSGNGTASCGTGCVGTFSFTPSFSVSQVTVGTVRVWAVSAKDGSPEHVNAIPVLLQP